jgi:hypothetical protein
MKKQACLLCAGHNNVKKHACIPRAGHNNMKKHAWVFCVHAFYIEKIKK